MTGEMAQVVDCLPSKGEPWVQTPVHQKKKLKEDNLCQNRKTGETILIIRSKKHHTPK
jgi:hypothetical protein